ncbi:MAG: hypothetical protein ACFFCS_07365 [Candidatus Hodarchaeota archaeon]
MLDDHVARFTRFKNKIIDEIYPDIYGEVHQRIHPHNRENE